MTASASRKPMRRRGAGFSRRPFRARAAPPSGGRPARMGAGRLRARREFRRRSGPLTLVLLRDCDRLEGREALLAAVPPDHIAFFGAREPGRSRLLLDMPAVPAIVALTVQDRDGLCERHPSFLPYAGLGAEGSGGSV